MEPLMEVLAEGLDTAVRRRLDWRVRAMDSHLSYIWERSLAPRSRWPIESVRIVIVLNSFYQIVLAPLAASTRSPLTSEVGEVPITYGTLRFDERRARPIRAAMFRFRSLLLDSSVPLPALRANHADDLLSALMQAEPDAEEWE